MRISRPKPRSIPPAPNRKFQLLRRLPPNLLLLVDNVPAPRGLHQKISHLMFNPTLDPKFSPTLNPMFSLPPRRLRPLVYRRVAVAAAVAAVAAVAVAANKPSRKPSLLPQ